jgi:hypothetical protein
MSASAAKRVQRELQDFLTRFRERAEAAGTSRASKRRGMQRYSLTIALIPTGEESTGSSSQVPP